MFRKLLILALGISVPTVLGAACDDKDHGDDDGHNDDGNSDDGNSDDGNSDDGQSDDGQSDDGQSDDGNSDSGPSDDSHGDDGSAQCQSPDDCPIIHCNCDSGIVNYTNCDNGKCGTEADCPDVCADFDQGGEESDGGGSTSW
jgi:hypothetical protein